MADGTSPDSLAAPLSRWLAGSALGLALAPAFSAPGRPRAGRPQPIRSGAAETHDLFARPLYR
jgi:hypothetical protein